MKRHDLDVISLVSGLLFAGLGAVFASHALGAFSVDVLVVPAVVLIVLGLAGIAAALTSTARPDAPDSPGANPVSSDPVPSDRVPSDRVPEP
jgi:hypothetical protein